MFPEILKQPLKNASVSDGVCSHLNIIGTIRTCGTRPEPNPIDTNHIAIIIAYRKAHTTQAYTAIWNIAVRQKIN